MKKKFNIVDICTVLLVIIFVIGIGVRFLSIEKEATEDIKLEFRVKVSDVREFTVNALEKSEDFSDGIDTVFGEIVNVESEPLKREYTTSEGDIVKTDVPEKYNCFVTMNVDATKKGNIYYMEDGRRISVGESFEIITKYVKTWGVIEEVTEINK